MMFSTRTFRNDGRNVRSPDDMWSALIELADMDDLLTHSREQPTRGALLPFSPFGFPAGEPGPAFHTPQAHMQPANLQE